MAEDEKLRTQDLDNEQQGVKALEGRAESGGGPNRTDPIPEFGGMTQDQVRMAKKSPGLEGIDTDLYNAMMAGDEQYVRSRLGGDRKLSEAEALILIKTREEEEIHAYEAQQAQMLQQKPEDAPTEATDHRSGIEYDKDPSATTGYTSGMDPYGGRTSYDDNGNWEYHDRFGGTYDAFGYTDKDGNLKTVTGTTVDTQGNITLSNGKKYEPLTTPLTKEDADSSADAAAYAAEWDNGIDPEKTPKPDGRKANNPPAGSANRTVADTDPEQHQEQGEMIAAGVKARTGKSFKHAPASVRKDVTQIVKEIFRDVNAKIEKEHPDWSDEQKVEARRAIIGMMQSQDPAVRNKIFHEVLGEKYDKNKDRYDHLRWGKDIHALEVKQTGLQGSYAAAGSDFSSLEAYRVTREKDALNKNDDGPYHRITEDALKDNSSLSAKIAAFEQMTDAINKRKLAAGVKVLDDDDCKGGPGGKLGVNGDTGHCQTYVDDKGNAYDTAGAYQSSTGGVWTKDGWYMESEKEGGGIWDAHGGYYNKNGDYKDPNGGFTWAADKAFMDAKGNYVDSQGNLYLKDNTTSTPDYKAPASGPGWADQLREAAKAGRAFDPAAPAPATTADTAPVDNTGASTSKSIFVSSLTDRTPSSFSSSFMTISKFGNMSPITPDQSVWGTQYFNPNTISWSGPDISNSSVTKPLLNSTKSTQSAPTVA